MLSSGGVEKSQTRWTSGSSDGGCPPRDASSGGPTDIPGLFVGRWEIGNVVRNWEWVCLAGCVWRVRVDRGGRLGSVRFREWVCLGERAEGLGREARLAADFGIGFVWQRAFGRAEAVRAWLVQWY